MLSRTMPPVGLVGVAFFRPHHACSLAPCTSESDSTHVFHVQLHVRLHPIAASRRTPDLFRTVLASLRLRCKKQGLALLRKVRCEQMPSLSLAQRLVRAHLSRILALHTRSAVEVLSVIDITGLEVLSVIDITGLECDSHRLYLSNQVCLVTHMRCILAAPSRS